MSTTGGGSNYGCRFYNVNYVTGPSGPHNISLDTCRAICSMYGGVTQYNRCATASLQMIVNWPGNGWCLKIMQCTSTICRCRRLRFPVEPP